MLSLEERVRVLERSVITLRRAVWLLALVATCAVALALTMHFNTNNNYHSESITAKNISVVDEKGVVRVRLSGAMPDGVMFGGRVTKRGTALAGLAIYDEEGIERGAYGTSLPGSHAMFTLDSKYRQAALFVAGPDDPSTSALTLWSSGSAIELRSDPLSSRISTSKDKQVMWQMPIVDLSGDACLRQRELAFQYPGEHVCQERYTNETCGKCLAK